ncbi:putative C6 transcription factor [Daldinia childiae]|uniref:putative C6 transcription factor n=1 Tax=Daldinia childiae TaxID=326645 RepID=UPI00144717F0|nr:putative C6 transcription factor [Daldinia childiae]KAF3063954.1 putative C6 transcription factor [Daldinia childiae]
MSQSAVAMPLGPEDDLKSYSCMICRQRKVKCDRRNPCSNCVKAEKQCSFVAPVRGKRKRTKLPKESLHAKLKRFEELLKSYGAKIEPSDDLDDSDSESISHPDDEIARSRSPSHSDPFFKLEESFSTCWIFIYFQSNDTPGVCNFHGVAIRLARKMGLHRDGSLLGLSPFETEMRRRLWWHLVHVDFRLADILGTRPSLDLVSKDTKIPLNVNDEDLDPDMVKLPLERKGITSITFCLIRCEILEALERFAPISTNGVHWEALRGSDIPLAEKNRIIDQIEDHLETKYLRYCDPLNSLHTFIAIMVRSSIGKMRVFGHSPRSSANRPIKMPQSERNIVFANCMKLLEYLTILHGGLNNMEKYMWQIGTSYLWGTMLYVLIETRNRKKGPEVDRTWQLIGEVYSHYPQIFEESAGPVFTAIGKWTLQVWNECAAALKAEGHPEPPMPQYIERIRRCREMSSELRFKPKGPVVDCGPVTPDSFDYTRMQSQVCEVPFTDLEAFGPCDFSDLLSLQMDSNNWIQWDQIIAEQSGFP